jgi:hypothetical protein
LFKLINEEGLWQTILRNKYLSNLGEEKKTKRLTLLARINESQNKFSHAWIIPVKQRKTNLILERQMAQKLLLPTTISVPIQLSKAEECDGRKYSKHGASKCLLP